MCFPKFSRSNLSQARGRARTFLAAPQAFGSLWHSLRQAGGLEPHWSTRRGVREHGSRGQSSRRAGNNNPVCSRKHPTSLGQCPYFPEPQLPHLDNGDNRAHLTGRQRHLAQGPGCHCPTRVALASQLFSPCCSNEAWPAALGRALPKLSVSSHGSAFPPRLPRSHKVRRSTAMTSYSVKASERRGGWQ